TSWGGTSYTLVAKLTNKSDEVLWESNTYKSSPNGTNGFNSGRAVVKKLMRDLNKSLRTNRAVSPSHFRAENTTADHWQENSAQFPRRSPPQFFFSCHPRFRRDGFCFPRS